MVKTVKEGSINEASPAFEGLAQFASVEDLLKNMAFDLNRMTNSSADQYAAFDFFVTAEHMLD